MKKVILVTLVTLLITPAIVSAAWWNPLSWFNGWDFIVDIISNQDVQTEHVEIDGQPDFTEEVNKNENVETGDSSSGKDYVIKTRDTDDLDNSTKKGVAPVVQSDVSIQDDDKKPDIKPEPTSATIDQKSISLSLGKLILSGKAYNISHPFGISLGNSGGKVWASGDISVVNNDWDTEIDIDIEAGEYWVNVYSNNILIKSQMLTITVPTSEPTCDLTSDKDSYELGEKIIYSWTSDNANYATWEQDTSGKDHLDLPGDKLSVNGIQEVTANVIGNPPVTLLVFGDEGEGSCDETVQVTKSAGISVSVDQDNLRYLPNSTINIIGNASSDEESLTVVIVGPDYSDSTDWNIVGNLLKGGSYTAMSKTIPVSGSDWDANFGGISSEGYYSVLIYDESYNLVAEEELWITYKG